jgi:hypothetical protein
MKENTLMYMSENSLKIGRQIKFPQGSGEIVGRKTQTGIEIIQVETESGNLRKFPTSLRCLKPV